MVMLPFSIEAGELTNSAMSFLTSGGMTLPLSVAILSASLIYFLNYMGLMQKIKTKSRILTEYRDISDVPIIAETARRFQKTEIGKAICSFVLGMEVDAVGRVYTTPLDAAFLIPIGWIKPGRFIKIGAEITIFSEESEIMTKIFSRINKPLASVIRLDGKKFVLNLGYHEFEEEGGRGLTHILESHFYGTYAGTTNFKQLGLKTEKEVENLVMKAAKEGKFIDSLRNKEGKITDIYRTYFNEKYDIEIKVSHDSGEIITAHPFVR